MISKLARQRRNAAYRLVLLQLAITLLMSGLGYVIWEKEIAMLVAKGGAIAVLPGFIFAFLAFSQVGGKAAKEVLGAFFFGESIKLMLTMVLFTYVFAVTELSSPAALFFGYVTALMAHWAAPLFFSTKTMR
ncbi:ATP synthase subunit I [Ferrimonas marina]|uniref:ATP synthase subunit I n=1 Tax=Ferrimonas marina TaxID=299255 RepID=UPI00082C653B|nr:ATP synthase subunit I [Ferrimonas marina]